MSDKPRKLFKADWRAPVSNSARYRYSRDELLYLFQIQDLDIEIDQAVFSKEPLEPCCVPGQSFAHELGVQINSRKPPPKKQKLPQWYTEQAETFQPNKRPLFQQSSPSRIQNSPSRAQPASKITLVAASNVKNLPQNLQNLVIQQKFSKVDQMIESKLKQELEEDETLPEWDDPGSPEESISTVHAMLGPVRYHPELLELHSRQGNPFAPIIVQNSTMDHSGALCPIPYSKPFEKVWYYKDPQQKVQGPFSSIQMFNWSAAGYFTRDLEIAHSNTTYFAPLYMYIIQTKQNQDYTYPKPDEQATMDLKSMLGLQPKHGWS